MTPEQHRLERARQQVASSTGSPPTGIDPEDPKERPGRSRPLQEKVGRSLTGMQIFLAVFFGVLLGQIFWSLIRRVTLELGWTGLLLY